uniref:Uncharacterized protein n=1 Tax=Anguilla anguilla TaxID=7936 RepID=A0A0E9VI31_ANGAN
MKSVVIFVKLYNKHNKDNFLLSFLKQNLSLKY